MLSLKNVDIYKCHCSKISGWMTWSSGSAPAFHKALWNGVCVSLLPWFCLVCSTLWLCLPCPCGFGHPAGGWGTSDFLPSIWFLFSQQGCKWWPAYHLINPFPFWGWFSIPNALDEKQLQHMSSEKAYLIPGDLSCCVLTLSLLLCFKNSKGRFKIMTEWIVRVFIITEDCTLGKEHSVSCSSQLLFSLLKL